MFAPMPNAIESAASVVNSGARRNVRKAKRTSAMTRLISPPGHGRAELEEQEASPLAQRVTATSQRVETAAVDAEEMGPPKRDRSVTLTLRMVTCAGPSSQNRSAAGSEPDSGYRRRSRAAC